MREERSGGRRKEGERKVAAYVRRERRPGAVCSPCHGFPSSCFFFGLFISFFYKVCDYGAVREWVQQVHAGAKVRGRKGDGAELSKREMERTCN